MRINGSTRIVGVMGYPVRHTASPAMHNAAFRALKLNYVYLPFEVRPEFVEGAVKSIISLDLVGLNVTVPHKRAVVSYLDRLSPEADFIQAVNTIVMEEGKLVGYNTDGEGFLKLLEEEGVDVEGKKIFVLGAGGASRAIVRELALKKVQSIIVANRTHRRGRDLVKQIEKESPSPSLKAIPLEDSALSEALEDADILINATSIGLRPTTDPLLISPHLLRKDMVVVDLIYNPPETPLLREAKRKGALAINGLGMLLHQGGLSFQLWTGVEPPLGVMREALKRAMESKR